MAQSHPIIFDTSWSEWHSLEGGYIVPEDSGIYCVHATRDDKSPLPIPRALGVDNEGIVYIGESINLFKRIGSLWWIMDDKPQDHQHHSLIASWVYYDLDRLVPRSQLRITWKVCTDHKKQ